MYIKTYIPFYTPRWLGGGSPVCLGYHRTFVTMVTVATSVKGQILVNAPEFLGYVYIP
jgi:hypothetical protein